jgi:hypothetical protein
MAEARPVRAFFVPAEAGQRVRVSVLYDSQWRSMFWFKLGRDGSLYFGPGYKPTQSFAVGQKKSPGREYTIGKQDLSEIAEPALIKDSHVSIHSSGAIHLGGRRYHREHLLSSS